MEPHCDYSKWFYTCLALIGVILAGLVMVFRYFLRITKDSVELKQADEQHKVKHVQNEQRIKSLESEIEDLKQIISEKKKKEKNSQKYE